MARFTRYTQIPFGTGANANQMAQFGSLAASAPMRFSGTTITPAIVQQLTNYINGWFFAVIGQNSPTIEDLNALCYLFGYQLAYLMQVGVAEWDSGTTYYIGDLASDGNGTLYVSLSDTNLNHPLSDSTKWTIKPQVSANSSGGSVTILTGTSQINPYLTIESGGVWTVQTGAQLVGVTSIIVLGTLSIQGTGIVRIL